MTTYGPETQAVRAVCYSFGNFSRIFIAKQKPGLRSLQKGIKNPAY
jgi:hypothetical protein